MPYDSLQRRNSTEDSALTFDLPYYKDNKDEEYEKMKRKLEETEGAKDALMKDMGIPDFDKKFEDEAMQEIIEWEKELNEEITKEKED